MKYIKISKKDGKEEVISRKKVLEVMTSDGYKDPLYVLEHVERLYGHRIGLTFSTIEIGK